jgi:hypothetical protein
MRLRLLRRASCFSAFDAQRISTEPPSRYGFKQPYGIERA